MAFDQCKAELDQKLTKAELKTAEKRILDVKTRLKPAERTAIVKAAKAAANKKVEGSGDKISAKSLGINKTQIHPEKSARVTGMKIIGMCEIVHDRKIKGLPVDDTVLDSIDLETLPIDEITADSTVGAVYALACETVFEFKGEETCMNDEYKKISSGTDTAETIKARGQLSSGYYRQKTDSSKAIGKLNANTQADMRAADTQSKAEEKQLTAATTHVSGVVKGNTSTVSLLFTHAQKLFDDVKIPRFAKTVTIENRIDALVNALPEVRSDFAKGKGKSEILKAVVPALKS